MPFVAQDFFFYFGECEDKPMITSTVDTLSIFCLFVDLFVCLFLLILNVPFILFLVMLVCFLDYQGCISLSKGYSV